MDTEAREDIVLDSIMDESSHNVYCPMYPKVSDLFWPKSTLCLCRELNASDAEAARLHEQEYIRENS